MAGGSASLEVKLVTCLFCLCFLYVDEMRSDSFLFWLPRLPHHCGFYSPGTISQNKHFLKLILSFYLRIVTKVTNTVKFPLLS